MSATYNWAYRPGITNKYGIIVPAGADNVKPTGCCYVALFGNDASGNGSRQYPYRTLTKALTIGGVIILGSGVYRESVIITSGAASPSLVGDGDVTIDISYNGALVNYNLMGSSYSNIIFRGNGTSVININGAYPSGNPTTAIDCVFNGAFTSASSYVYFAYYNCIISNYSGAINPTQASGAIKSCTFVNCNNISMSSVGIFDSCIFYSCNISGAAPIGTTRYSLFYQCNFKLNGSGSGGTLYPSTPSGYTYYSTIASLQAAFNAIYSTLSLTGCTIADPLFSNLSIGDYSLTFGSPAKNLSYFGTYVGAKSICQAIKIRAIEADGDLDFSTAVNVTIADNSVTLTDTSQDGIIETKVLVNSLGRQLKSIPIIGFNADRNGQYIDSIADKAATTYAAGDTLPATMPFIVESGSIILLGVVYTAGQRGTTGSTTSTFTTSTGGVVREILEAPQRHTVEMKLGDVQPFTTEVLNHFEPGIAPTTNNVSDLRTGAILRGNGDPNYIRGSLGVNEFPVNTKYVKIRFTIRHDNLKP